MVARTEEFCSGLARVLLYQGDLEDDPLSDDDEGAARLRYEKSESMKKANSDKEDIGRGFKAGCKFVVPLSCEGDREKCLAGGG